jgi:uncharacterized membrane protein HdeD (DUF308 family)
MNEPSTAAIAKESIGWSIALSILMILAGVLAIIVPPAAGVATTIVVGWLLLFSGAAHLVFGWYTRSTGGLVWEFLIALLYFLVGGYLLFHLAAGLAALTIALAIFLLLEGIVEFGLSFLLRPLPGSGWLLISGILTLILAVLIWRAWPSSKVWAIGLLVGVSMLFSGVTRLVLSIEARHVVSKFA